MHLYFRREDVVKYGGKGSGVTWSGSVRKFIQERFFKDRVKSMPSNSTIRHIGLAPNRANTASKYYRNIIPARPGSAQNNATLGTPHINTHSCSTMVKYGMEMAALNPEIVTAMSCDNKVYISGSNPQLASHKILLFAV